MDNGRKIGGLGTAWDTKMRLAVAGVANRRCELQQKHSSSIPAGWPCCDAPDPACMLTTDDSRSLNSCCSPRQTPGTVRSAAAHKSSKIATSFRRRSDIPTRLYPFLFPAAYSDYYAHIYSLD